MKIYETTTYHKFKNKVPLDPTRRNTFDSLSTEYSQFENVKNKLKFLNQNISRAANRGKYSKEIDIDLDYLYKIGEKQNWMCALTGIPLEFTRGGTFWGGKWCNPNSCTIDRIDNSKGYVKGNVQLVAWKPNCMRNHWPLKEFINMCKIVAQNHQ